MLPFSFKAEIAEATENGDRRIVRMKSHNVDANEDEKVDVV